MVRLWESCSWFVAGIYEASGCINLTANLIINRHELLLGDHTIGVVLLSPRCHIIVIFSGPEERRMRGGTAQSPGHLNKEPRREEDVQKADISGTGEQAGAAVRAVIHGCLIVERGGEESRQI